MQQPMTASVQSDVQHSLITVSAIEAEKPSVQQSRTTLSQRFHKNNSGVQTVSFCRSLFSLVFVSMCVLTMPDAIARAAGLDTNQRFEIPAGQSLDSALLAFSDQARVQVLMWTGTQSNTRVTGKTVGVSGELSGRSALESLLADTGLAYKEIDEGTVAIVNPANTTNSALAGSHGLMLAAASSPSPSESGAAAAAVNSSTALGAASGGKKSEPVILEEVIVTGTNIRGVSPVGSSVISVGADEFQKTAAADAISMLSQLPQLTGIGYGMSTNMGGSRVQGAGINSAAASSVNLRGLGQLATLTLVNGQRLPYSAQGNIVDPNNFPASLIQRVEVQAEGGSAIYGSDAIAGTVNFILREPVDTMETAYQVGFKKGNSKDWQIGQTLGKTWKKAENGIGDGGIILVFQRQTTGAVPASALSYAYNDDLSPYYPTGLQSTNSNPGNVRGFAPTPNVLYPVPASGIGATQGLTLAQLGTGGLPNRTSAFTNVEAVLPEIRRDSVAANFKQEITDWLHFFAFGHYNDRDGYITNGGAPQIAANISLPTTNPYSPCAPGADTSNTQGLVCPAGNLTVASNLSGEMGIALRHFSEVNYMHAAGFDFDLPYGWKGTISESFGKDYLYSFQGPNGVNATAFAQVVTGVNKPANVPFYNPFCSDAAGPCNSPITLSYINQHQAFKTSAVQRNYNANFDGPLFPLPGGEVRFAVGGNYNVQSYSLLQYSNNSAAIGTDITSIDFNATHRHTTAEYAEVYVPVIGRDMAIPAIQQLELTAAIRHTSFDLPDVSTTNHKFGLNWVPFDGVKIRSSYGTSFRVGNLSSISPGGVGSINSYAGTTCGAYAGIVCPTPATAVVPIAFSGPNPNAEPETGDSLTIGLDWSPAQLPGLTTSLTWYKMSYLNQLGSQLNSALPVAAANAGYYDKFLIFNPTYFPSRAIVNPAVLEVLPNLTPGAPLTQAQFDSVIPTLLSRPLYSTTVLPTSPVPFIGNALYSNNGGVRTSGIDFSTKYVFDTGWGSAHVGGTGTYVLDYKIQPLVGGPTFQEKNNFGYVTQLHGRLDVGLDNKNWNVTLYMNYTNAYHADAIYVPVAALNQNPDYLNISSNTTFDLSLGYGTSSELDQPLLHNIQLQLVVNNLLDKKPPFFLNAAASPPILYDPNQASALGRVITFRINKKW